MRISFFILSSFLCLINFHFLITKWPILYGLYNENLDADKLAEAERVKIGFKSLINSVSFILQWMSDRPFAKIQKWFHFKLWPNEICTRVKRYKPWLIHCHKIVSKTKPKWIFLHRPWLKWHRFRPTLSPCSNAELLRHSYGKYCFKNELIGTKQFRVLSLRNFEAFLVSGRSWH